VGELDLRRFVAGRGEEDEGEAPFSLSTRRSSRRPSSSKKRIVSSGSETRIIVCRYFMLCPALCRIVPLLAGAMPG
jgi:hypothetical protein